MVRDGIPYVVAPLILAVAPAVFGFWPVSLGLVAVSGYMGFFFRDPKRRVPTEKGIIVSPADGRVTLVKRASRLDAESLVSIFLSPLDVHVNRSPIAGEIVDVASKRGKFLMATNASARM